MTYGWLYDKTNKRFGPKFRNFKHLKKSRGVHRKNTYWTHPGHERQQKVTMIVLCRVAYLQFRSRRSQKNCPCAFIQNIFLKKFMQMIRGKIYINSYRWSLSLKELVQVDPTQIHQLSNLAPSNWKFKLLVTIKCVSWETKLSGWHSNRYTWTDLKIGLLLSAWLVWSVLGWETQTMCTLTFFQTCKAAMLY